jgi:thymidylate synthase
MEEIKSEIKGEYQYLNLVKKVLETGQERQTRNSVVKSLFNYNMVFDMKEGFPLITTKKMFWRGIVEELLFFLSGKTDTKILEEKGINIWRENTSREFLDSIEMKDRKEGLMGPMYGFQWRFFNAEYNEETGLPIYVYGKPDQIRYVIDTIKKDPFSRRIIMTCFNPEQTEQSVLYPCHSIILQFYIREIEGKKYLDMFAYNRSSDILLGLPFNIAGSALLLCIIANLTDIEPGVLYITGGDCHIYQNHYKASKEQLSKTPYPFPKLVINKKLELDKINYEDFTLENYICHPSIKADMVA